METLPSNAMIVPERYEFVTHLKPGCTENCTLCHQPFTVDVFLVAVSSTLVNGQPTLPDYQMVCSRECAMKWLQDYQPEFYMPYVGFTLNETPVKTPLEPSKVKERGWIYAIHKNRSYPIAHPLRSGKWLIFLSATTVDRYWQRIAEAVLRGKLGDEAKVSTAKSAQRPDGANHVICVYTYDYEDKEDVMRIRAHLKACGIVRQIRYKRDLDTTLLRYNKDYTPIYVV